MTALWKRYIMIALSVFLLIGFPEIGTATGTPTPNMSFTAEGIVLMDANTGTILYEKNMHEVLYPASTTKILTAILALEQEDLDELVVTSKDARYATGNRIYLSEGEEKPLIDLVYGIMLNSGNDAAIAIAEHIGGTVEGFSKMMNDKAREIGAIDSNFVNPSGLPDDEHVSTAYDLAKIGQYALQIDELREIATTQAMPWIGEEWVSNLVNTNRLLWDYEGATGLKTGYTTLAQQTFVGSAERDGMELIVVLLRTQGRNNLWKESKHLLDFGFEHFEREIVVARGQSYEVTLNGKEAQVAVVEDIFATVPKNKEEVNKYHTEVIIHETSTNEMFRVGDEIGTLFIKRGEEIVGEGNLQLVEIEEGYEAVEELVVAESLQSSRSIIAFLHPHGWILLFLLLAARWIHGLRRNRRYRKSVSRHFP